MVVLDDARGGAVERVGFVGEEDLAEINPALPPTFLCLLAAATPLLPSQSTLTQQPR